MNVGPEVLKGETGVPAIGIYQGEVHNKRVIVPPAWANLYGKQPNCYTVVSYSPTDPGDTVLTTTVADVYEEYRDDWPEGLYRPGHIQPFITRKLANIPMASDVVLVPESEDPHALGEQFVTTFLRNQDVLTTFIIEEKNIVSFLKGFIEASEADKQKRMATSGCNYMLPRVDADLEALIVSSYLGGVSQDALPIPEEHRYRVLINLADMLAWYHTQHKNALDDLLKPAEEFRDEVQYEAVRYLSRPLAMIHQLYQPYENSVGHITSAYDISRAELTEAVRMLWQGHMYWYHKADALPLSEIRGHFNRTPEAAEWARQFIAETPPAALAHYNAAIEATVAAAMDIKYLADDFEQRT